MYNNGGARNNAATGRSAGLSIDAQQARDYHSAEAEAHAILEDDASSGDEVADSLRHDAHRQQQHQLQHQEQQHYHHEEGHDDEMMEDEEEHDEGDAFDSDSMSSSPSIPDDDIDFNLVYALHTFLATVDGQASVVKGDKLLLLDDTNSYWWLVRVIKTQAVGYIPAENIETPFERLARLNKHRNVDLTSIIPADYVSGPTSTHAKTRFDSRIPPSRQPHPHQSQHPHAKGVLASPSHKDHPRNISPTGDRPERAGSSKSKTVIFTAPTYYEHSANGESGDEEDFEEGEYDEEMEQGEEGELRGDQVFDDDDEGEESEFSDDGLTEEIGQDGTAIIRPTGGAAERQAEVQEGGHYQHQHQAAQEFQQNDEVEEDRIRQQREYHQQQQQALEQQQQQTQAAMLHQQQQQRLIQQQQEALQQQELQLQQQRQRSVSASGPSGEPRQQAQRRPSDIASNASVGRRPSDSSSSRSLADDGFDPNAPTKKLTATPPIVRDPTFDINNPYADLPGGVPRPSSPVRVRGVEVVDPKDPRYQKLISDRTPGDHLVARQQSIDGSYTGLEENSFDTNNSSGFAPRSSTQSWSDDGRGTSAVGSGPVLGLGQGVAGGPAAAATSAVSGKGKLMKKNSGRESASEGGGEEKKRKSGGILSGLFKKKDKKKKEDGDAARTSEESIHRQDTIASTTSDQQVSPRPSTESKYANVGPPPIVSLGAGPPTSSGFDGDVKREGTAVNSMFSDDATLRQQEVEAKQAMLHQYGVQRLPGDISNSMAPRSAAMSNQTLSPGSGFSPATSQAGGPRIRPGSLIGSPSIPGLDVPLLSVLRVFAGDHIESEATFKTVLLNRSTTSSDLVKQSIQRFRLTGAEETDEYYLTVKEVGGDERVLADEQKPLVIFEALSQTDGNSGFAIPSVKRSSIGSISSISSSLSLNPAITRLGMNDFSDDSAVKFYLNRRQPEEPSMISQSESESVSTPTGGAPGLSPFAFEQASTTPAASPSFRFALRVKIHPEDLPENIAFDPQSNAIIPKAVLLERQQRNGDDSDIVSPVDSREKIIFFPRNVNVSEVIEASLDRFGIVDAVVDGGDEVEDRLSRRRSSSRVKYALAVYKDNQETLLPSSGKIIDTYTVPPAFKPYDRSSKEFRRRSVDATLILGAPQDIQDTDPVFVIRRAPTRSSNNFRAGLSPTIQEEGSAAFQAQQARSQKRRSQDRQSTEMRLTRGERPEASRSSTMTSVGESVYETPREERMQEIFARAASPQATQKDIIAAQRVVSRANQLALLSAQKNSEQGVDIVVPESGTIRSVKNSKDHVRYSYIDENGRETDISKLMEAEWASDKSKNSPAEAVAGDGRPSLRSISRQTNESFHSAVESPTSAVSFSTDSLSHPSVSNDEEDEEERLAISALRSTSVAIDQAPSPPPDIHRLQGASSSASLGTRPDQGGDLLQDALGARRATSPLLNESLQDRLDRVLAKVREDKAAGRSGSPAFRSRSAGGSATPNGRASPGSIGGRATSPLVGGERKVPGEGRSRSPLGGRESPSIEQIIAGARSGSSSGHGHAKKPSIASMSSTGTGATGTSTTDQPSTPVTGGSNGNLSTPISSVNSNHRAPVAYHDDFGLDTLMAIVNSGSQAAPVAPRMHDSTHDALFGRSIQGVEPEVHGWFEDSSKTLDDLDSRLDALLLQMIST